MRITASVGCWTTGRHLTRALDASLRRLGVETIDLYQLHGWDTHIPVEETLSFLDDAIRAGKIHHAGLSNFTGWQLQLTVSTAKAMGVHVPLTLQQQYSLLSRESEFEMIPAARHNNIGLLPWSPLAGGLLTGKYQRGTTPAPDPRAGSDDALYRWVSAEYASLDRNWATIDQVVRIAAEIGTTPAQVALSWIADRPGVTAPIFGARRRPRSRSRGRGPADVDRAPRSTQVPRRPLAASVRPDRFTRDVQWRWRRGAGAARGAPPRTRAAPRRT
ncbi:aldo/keto reductase [Streptomyces malaysiensis]|uniref:aldo/keto reductase n=1 Tax=Streptomyces malaysiensis TaxID=92644 RepID=UPI0028C4EDD2|nr:aldo/keto reductase [Streptomyces malaysiensis]